MDVGKWILGGSVGVLGLAALFLAGRSHDAIVQNSALGLFLVCILFIMMQIKHAYEDDHSDH